MKSYLRKLSIQIASNYDYNIQFQHRSKVTAPWIIVNSIPLLFIFYDIKRKIDEVFRIITYYDIKQNEKYNKQSFLLLKSATNLTFCQNYVFEKI